MQPPWRTAACRSRVAAAWWRHSLKWAWLAGVSCLWAATDITLTIDCAFCGPGQTFPHDCPRVNSPAAALATAEAFSNLLATARREVSQLRSVGGMNIPDLGLTGSLAQLDAALGDVIAASEEEIARCDREQAEFVRQSESAGSESILLDELATAMAGEIEQSRSAIAETDRQVAAELRAASAARDETVAVQKSLNRIRSEITKTRNQLFPRLHQAAHHGWILPPSSYRSMPRPMPTVKEDRGRTSGDAMPASLPRPSRDRPDIAVNRVASSPTSQIGARPPDDVQAKLAQLPDLVTRARAAAARRDAAIRSLERRRSETDDRSARLSALQPQRTSAANQLAASKRNLVIARDTHAQFTARLDAVRAGAVHAWIEWGIYQLLDRKASRLLGNSDVPPSPGSVALEDWKHIAATAVRLGSEPLAVLAEFPAALAARGESLAELQQDLARVREKFGVSFAASHADLPATALPYAGNERP